MKQGEESISAQAEIGVWQDWSEKKLPGSGNGPREPTAAQTADHMHIRTAEFVLFFLDLARTAGDEAYLEVAEAGAKHLADTWRSLYLNPEVIDGAIGTAATNGLSRAAFALGQAWRVTNNSNYQDAGLEISSYVAGIRSISRRK